MNPNPNRPLKIKKRDAAKRQLETALRLWFEGGDPVSIHTLAAASNEVIHRLGTKKGRPALLQEWLSENPKIRSRMVNVQNFFKHASIDSNPSETITLFRHHSEILLYDSVICWRRNFRASDLMFAFALRFRAEHRNRWPVPPWLFESLNRADLVQFARGSRKEFLDELLETLRAHRGKQRRRS